MPLYPLGEFLKKVRMGQGMAQRELARKTEKNPYTATVSSSYYSQVETAQGINPEKVSMDFFWAVGVALNVDPLKLFVLPRPSIPQEFAERAYRDKFFTIG